jgi:hypothetical protein
MPNDGSHVVQFVWQEQTKRHLYMLPGRLAVGVIDHKAPNIILFSCITTALLLPCDSDQQLSPWVSLHLTHTHSHTTDFLALQTSTSVGNTSALLLPSPHCDAASQTPTLPIKETTETPPPQAVKLHTICGPYINLACYIYCFLESLAFDRCLHLQTTRKAEADY